jgi:methylenetetrahydrofolate reductase (NADPH)
VTDACADAADLAGAGLVRQPDHRRRRQPRILHPRDASRCLSRRGAPLTTEHHDDGLVSFEFFPPNTPEGVVKLRATRASARGLRPEFFSVTYGAGGATRDKTFATVLEIAARAMGRASHLSCVGATRRRCASCSSWRAMGVRRLVALRGDLPSGMVNRRRVPLRERPGRVRPGRDRRLVPHRGGRLPEAHPQARAPRPTWTPSPRCAPAPTRPITQYVLQRRRVLPLRSGCGAARASSVPIVPGIMPITNYTQLRVSPTACGAEIPRWIAVRLASLRRRRRDAIRAFGADVVGRAVPPPGTRRGAPHCTSTR